MANTSTASRLALALAVSAAVTLVGFPSQAQEKPPLVFMTWGGVWQQTFDKIAKDYEAKTKQPVTVVAQGAGEAGLARLIAQKSNPEVDVWSTNMINYERAKKAGVLAPLDKAHIPNVETVNGPLVYSH